MIDRIGTGVTSELSPYSNLTSIISHYFSSKYIPEVTIKDYIKRLYTSSNDPEEIFICTYIIIKRFYQKNSIFANNENIHRIFLVAYVCTCKFILDMYLCMSEYARIGGISVHEINSLEKLFLLKIDWDLYISPNEYSASVDYLKLK